MWVIIPAWIFAGVLFLLLNIFGVHFERSTVVGMVIFLLAATWVAYSNDKEEEKQDIKKRLRRLESETDDLKEENKRLQERLIALGDEDETN